MKRSLCVWLLGSMAVVLSSAVIVFLRGWLRIAAVIAIAAAFALFAARYAALRYELTDREIRISGGLFFKRVKAIERASILSVSRLYLGRRLICTVVRTAGSADLLFCSLPKN